PAGSGETAQSQNVALTAAWQPDAGGWPSINLGWGMSVMQQAASLPVAHNAAVNIAETRSWSAALLWRNLLGSGHAAGLAVGQPTYVSRLRDGRTPQDGNYAWEAWLAWRMSNHITLTPSLFYLSRPNGQYTAPGRSSNALGTVLVAHFRF
ncbi:MAG: carbohydrate porin, partial [Cyanobium sp.]